VGLQPPFHYMNSPDGRPADGSSATEGGDVPAGGRVATPRGTTNSSLRMRAMPRLPRQTDPRPKRGPDRPGSFTRHARLNHKSEDEALRGLFPTSDHRVRLLLASGDLGLLARARDQLQLEQRGDASSTPVIQAAAPSVVATLGNTEGG